MKICFVCQYYYPESFMINDLTKELSLSGHEVTVLTGLPNYPEGKVEKSYRFLKKRYETINGVNVIRASLIGRGTSKVRLVLNYLSFAVSASLKALMMKKEFDLVIIYQLSPITMAIPGLILKKLIKKPCILYCFDLWPESIVSGGLSSDGLAYNMLYKLCYKIYKQADLILVSSRYFQKYFNETFNLSENIKYLPIYAEAYFDGIKSVENGTIDLLFAGNIGHMQNVETIILAAKELEKDERFVFHIVGEGSSKESCEALARKFELKNVHFYGRFKSSEMPRFYELADAFLVTLRDHPTINYTLPGKVQSYMAAAKPIIGAVNGETQYVIKDAKCGYCSNAQDPLSLANNIKEFGNNLKSHHIMGANARTYYETNYSKQAFMSSFNKIIDKIQMEESDV